MITDKTCKCSFATIAYRDASGSLKPAMLVHNCAEHSGERSKVRAYLRAAFKRPVLALPAPTVAR